MTDILEFKSKLLIFSNIITDKNTLENIIMSYYLELYEDFLENNRHIDIIIITIILLNIIKEPQNYKIKELNHNIINLIDDIYYIADTTNNQVLLDEIKIVYNNILD